LPIAVVAPGIPTTGPVTEFVDEIKAMHQRRFA
jgi:hypothetical protein